MALATLSCWSPMAGSLPWNPSPRAVATSARRTSGSVPGTDRTWMTMPKLLTTSPYRRHQPGPTAGVSDSCSSSPIRAARLDGMRTLPTARSS